jgi:glycosyltransferase involved in cell wall biosynthesis
MPVFFSIVMPTYNCKFISRAISSVINQTYNNWELIIIDNFSTNSAEETVKKYNDSRIRYFKLHNEGLISKSRNYGIQLSKGEWIAFLDSDDYWNKKKLEIVNQNILITNQDLYHHGLYKVSEGSNFINKKISDKSRPVAKPIFENLLINGNGIGNSSVVVRKNFLYKINLISEERNKFSWEDFDTWLRLSQITDKFFYIPKILGYCWVGQGRVSNIEQTIKNYKSFKNYYKIYLKKKLKSIFRFHWIDYHYALVNFKKKKYKSAYVMSKKIKVELSKVGLMVLLMRLLYFKTEIINLFRKFYKGTKKFFTIILVYNFSKKNFFLNSNEDFIFKIINNFDEFSSLEINNFFLNYDLRIRFQRGDKMSIIYNDNKIYSYGWIRSKDILIEEINFNLINKGNIILYDFFTFEEYRNKGYYFKNILNIANFFKEKDLYIYTTFLNIISKKVILKSGFNLNKILFYFTKSYTL